ncbi:MAG: phosphohistidine phosphatase SixA [Candidatus Kuenenia sp.]|nr:phosphohistidine phosphatase SixA [Candidatus Kuenenia hertensis]
MILYLVRHGEAKSEKEHKARPLSENGVRNVNKVAAHVSRLNITVDRIFHSSKLRAKQTAEILAEYLKPSGGVAEAHGLTPLDDPMIWAERLKGETDNTILLAGHLPHLSKLASFLLCRNEGRDFISFKPAGMVCLKREDNGTWSLLWMINPEIL